MKTSKYGAVSEAQDAAFRASIAELGILLSNEELVSIINVRPRNLAQLSPCIFNKDALSKELMSSLVEAVKKHLFAPRDSSSSAGESSSADG